MVPLCNLVYSVLDTQHRIIVMFGEYEFAGARIAPGRPWLMLPFLFILGACTAIPDPVPTNIWISTHLEKTTDAQWIIDCAKIENCETGGCNAPYRLPVKLGTPPHDDWVKLANADLSATYEIRFRLRKVSPGASSEQKPEYRCRTGVFTLCSSGMRQITSAERPWLNIQFSDELSFDGPNVLISKGFTHLVSTPTSRNSLEMATPTETASSADTSEAFKFRRVNGDLRALCAEESELGLGPTWFAAKFAWPSPREDCPAQCPEAGLSPTTLTPASCIYEGARHISQDDFKAALLTLTKCCASNSSNPRCWRLLGRAYSELGQEENGKSCYDKADSLETSRIMMPTQ